MAFEGYNWNTTGIKEGEDIERGFFGQAVSKYGEELHYQNYESAKKEAMARQPDRLPRIAQKLIYKLDELYPDLAGKMKYYTAVGTAFDVYHGVDAFVTLGDYTVTLDVTTNSAKESAKADIIVHTGYQEDGDIDFSDIQINILAQRIGKEFIAKIQKK